ncbi:MAG: exopolysaccharide biosynthesis polyprenyl glycosylphosphotransferase [Verrucomicrobia bacterium]|nr:exopolysaccharide biosynthesis polyprenyl glycosylphosphotransferase [Verrucomicrobiota bacterium]
MLIRKRTAAVLVSLDLGMLVFIFNVVGWLRGIIPAEEFVLVPLLGPAALLILVIYLIDGYKSRTDMMSLDYTSQHIIALAAAMLATLTITFALIPSGYTLQQSRSVIIVSFLVLIPATLFYRRVLSHRFHNARRGRSLVFLGSRANCLDFKTECTKQGLLQPVILCSVSEPDSSESPALLAFDDVLNQLKSGQLEIEALVLRESNRELTDELSQTLIGLYFKGVPTYTLELFHQTYWRKIPLYRLNQTWLFQEGFQIAREPVFERIKRLSDIVLSSIGMVLGSLAIAIAAVAIKLEDGGPVFFRQTRIGRNRTPFSLFKLRTMRLEATGGAYTEKNDRRITRVGRFLRASRIDEIPQLMNVFLGEMSLIGPRAEWDKLVAEYETQIPCYHFRHLVKPGITGWAQINYPYGASLEDTLRKLEYDLYYIRHFSFILDASIVLKTIHIMLFGKGR